MISPTDRKKYDFINLPVSDAWGLLMRKDSPLAEQAEIHPGDLLGLPIIAPRQVIKNRELSGWMPKGVKSLHVVGTYNLLFNAALMVEEGVGYALGINKILVESSRGDLCYRPLKPEIRVNLDLVWKKDRIFPRAAELFLQEMGKQTLNE